MTTLEEVIARLERAAGPDRELDADIIRALYPACHIGPYVVGDDEPVVFHAEPLVQNKHEVPRYTSSLDAALTLVPEGWFVANFAQWRSGAPTRTWAATLKLDPDCDEERHTSNRPSAALALCLAALRARLSQPPAITAEE